MYDLIGDIHGHADKLKLLLDKLGYSFLNDCYSHPSRKVLFIGDYIDRGPEIPETLKVVKSMVDTGNAIALMGNHEFNAICFHTSDGNGGYLREHSEKNEHQHSETLKQFAGNESGLMEYLEWFRTLPLYFKTSSFKAVHACWDEEHIDVLKKYDLYSDFSDDLLSKAVDESSDLYNAIEIVLKGHEMNLPDGKSFIDSDGIARNKIRIKWWENPYNMTYRSICVHDDENLPDSGILKTDCQSISFYRDELPVFFGHYWLKGKPVLLKPNICCLDYSVAKQGELVAYRMNNEKYLDENNLVYV